VNPTSAAAIKDELYNNGPLEGAFTVYEDFFSYSSGVYYHVSAVLLVATPSRSLATVSTLPPASPTGSAPTHGAPAGA